MECKNENIKGRVSKAGGRMPGLLRDASTGNIMVPWLWERDTLRDCTDDGDEPP